MVNMVDNGDSDSQQKKHHKFIHVCLNLIPFRFFFKQKQMILCILCERG